MKTSIGFLLVACACALVLLKPADARAKSSATVPMVLDHNRILVDAEIQRKDGTWRAVRLWVDTGNPDFFMSESVARDLGIDLSGSSQNTVVPPTAAVRIDGMKLDFSGVRSTVMVAPHWLFSAMHNDGNLPSTVLKKYHVVFDYPARRVTIAQPGVLAPSGTRASASIDPKTGIPQIDAVVDGDSMSFALDNGASYSFASGEVVERLLRRHPNWPHMTGTCGCANMWGWWPPHEETMPVVRLPEITWGPVRLANVAIVGVGKVRDNGPSMGAWYSHKTARPVVGFLGPNAFKAFRVEIDYANSAIYFKKGERYNSHDMDLVALTLRPEKDGNYTVIGIPTRDGKPVVTGVEPGDVLMGVDDLETTGATFGTVVDALRGKPGDVHVLELKRNGKRIKVEAKVARVL